MKAIGFIDYYVSEWHANHYPEWIKEANKTLGTDFVVKYAWAEKPVSPVDGKTTDEWCKEYGVEKCATIEELCEKSDYILVLAPSDPDTHLRYAEIALKYGKNTYIDKTFAPDYETALKIFEIGKKYGAKFFSTSALRYASELSEYAGECETATVIGSGASVSEYVIHQTEMLVKLMGVGAKRLTAFNDNDQHVIRVEYADGRKANMVFVSDYGTPTAFIPYKNGGKSKFIQITSEYFRSLMADILKFYESGKLPFDSRETLEVMKVRDAIIKSETLSEQWIEI